MAGAQVLLQKSTRDSILAAAAVLVQFDTDLPPSSLLNVVPEKGRPHQRPHLDCRPSGRLAVAKTNSSTCQYRCVAAPPRGHRLLRQSRQTTTPSKRQVFSRQSRGIRTRNPVCMRSQRSHSSWVAFHPAWCSPRGTMTSITKD